MNNLKLLTASTILAFIFIFAMTALDVVLSYMGWKPTFGDDLLAGIIGFLPSVGSVALSMLIGITPSWRAKILSAVIWLFCISISLTGNFLNMTARAFESLDTENIAKVEVVNIKDTNQAQIGVYKDANQAQLDLYDEEITDLNAQFIQARESRDFQINDGVNKNGTMGPKARAFQASMDRISLDIEGKRAQKRELQAESSAALIAFQVKSLDTLSEATVDLAETQNDMRGHMPVIRYFIPDKDQQRTVVLWGLGLFAAVISLAGPVVSYAIAVHLNHKKLRKQQPLNIPAVEEEAIKEEIIEEVEVVEGAIKEEIVEEGEVVEKEVVPIPTLDERVLTIVSDDIKVLGSVPVIEEEEASPIVEISTSSIDEAVVKREEEAKKQRMRALRNSGYV